MDSAVVGDLVATALLHVGAANLNEVLHDLRGNGKTEAVNDGGQQNSGSQFTFVKQIRDMFTLKMLWHHGR